MAFKDNKRQRGQKNADHRGHQNEKIRVQELEGHRENQHGHHLASPILKKHEHEEAKESKKK